MRNRIFSLWFATLALAFAVPAVSLGQAGPPPADPAGAIPPGIEVQTRGPVHEAFAEPVGYQPEPSPVVPQAPPDPIPEEPPDQRPEGANVEWIGGYWAWDADRNEFIWVSGTYRNVPPGQRWVPGYWENSPDGWRWVPGLWAPDTQAELPYLPQPPAPLNLDPTTPPPDDNSFWTPGCWIYRQTRYVWRPGFWQGFRPGFVWMPACYSWTPSGYVFNDGYWDYPLDGRGLLFAPVCFTQPLWQTPGWFYQPSYAVGYGPLLNSLFVRPRWGSYYFGDYYGARYAGLGFQPWYAYGPRYRDPLFGYYGWANRGNPGWQAGLRRTYLDRVAGRVPLPPRTLAAQNLLLRRSSTTIGRNNSLQMVSTLNQFRSSNVRLTRVSAAQRSVLRTGAVQQRTFAATRSRTEAALRTSRPGFAGGRSVGALRLPAGGASKAVLSPHLSPASRPGTAHLPGSSKAAPYYRPTSPTAPGSHPVRPPSYANNLRPGGTPAWSRPNPPHQTPQRPYRSVGNPTGPSALTTRTPGQQPRTSPLTQRPTQVTPRTQAVRPAATQTRTAAASRYTPQANPARTAPAYRQPAARPTRPAVNPARRASAPARTPAAQPRSYTAARTATSRPPTPQARPVQATRSAARPAVSRPAPAQGGRQSNNPNNRQHR